MIGDAPIREGLETDVLLVFFLFCASLSKSMSGKFPMDCLLTRKTARFAVEGAAMVAGQCLETMSA